MNDKNNLIEVIDLERRYGEIHAVRGINFSLERGEVLGFLGPNGAGKSTTMKMLAGTLAPSAGRIRICGTDLAKRAQAAKRLIGYLPERPPLYPELSVAEYLSYCATLRGLRSTPAAESLRRVIARCGLDEVRRRLIGNLSRGYQQRVGIAQAIIHEPEVVILDEPTAGLDPRQVQDARALIREIGRERGVILSTHILPEVQSVCDRVQILHEGRLVLQTSVHSLAENSASVALRVGLRRAPSSARLLEVSGAARVEPIAGGRFRLAPGKPPLDIDRLVAASVDEGWELFELIEERSSLEDTFIELTCNGRAQPDRGVANESPEKGEAIGA